MAAAANLDNDAEATSEATADSPGESLPLYLQEIGRVALLTASDEVRLSQAIERGRLAAEQLQGEDSQTKNASSSSSSYAPATPRARTCAPPIYDWSSVSRVATRTVACR